MSRQHATPILVSPEGRAVPLTPLSMAAGADQVSEATIQALVHAHPECLPIAEIDPVFANPVPVCTELNTRAGPIDNLLVTPSGLPVLVECKLWRNPEGRREVVGQILDYAKELSRWTSSDLQREASRRLGRGGNVLLDLVREAGHSVDEIAFNDALTFNLRQGRFLLLIVGDGIREGVEAIAEYLQAHAGLRFTLGLVEMPVFTLADGRRLVTPRVLARTVSITREVVALPEGLVLSSDVAGERDDDGLTDEEESRRSFMQEVVAGLTFDDPDQPTPKVTPKGWLFLCMPVPASSCWIGVLDQRSSKKVGVRLTSNVNTIGEAAIARVVRDWATIEVELGGTATLDRMSDVRFRVDAFLDVDRDAGTAERERAVIWFRERVRDFISVFRHRIRDAVDDMDQG